MRQLVHSPFDDNNLVAIRLWWMEVMQSLQIFCPRLLILFSMKQSYLSIAKITIKYKVWRFFFLSGFSFTDTSDSQDSRAREDAIFYSSLPLPPTDEHSDIYLQLCMWHNQHVLIASLAFTSLLLDEIYQLIKLPLDWLIM